jgi:uncharacterized membrane protein YphA (DoxX/SURF4 family)
LALAAVFGVAAVGKFLDVRGSQDAVKAFGVPEAIAPVVAVSLPIVEALIAIGLVPASFAVAAAAAGLALLATFIILISFQLARGRRPDCHCFGQLHSAPVGLGTIARNLVLAGGAVIVITADGGKTLTTWWDGLTATGRMGFAVAGSLGVLVVAEAAILWKLFVRYGKLLVRVEDLEATGPTAAPRSLAPAGAGHAIGTVGPPFALQGLHGETITLAALLARSRPTLLLFTDPQCGPCGALIPEIVAWQQALETRLTLTIISRGDAQDNVAKFSSAGVTGVLLQRDREVSDAYLSPGTPSCVLIDPDGAIASELAAGADSIRRLVRDVSGLQHRPRHASVRQLRTSTCPISTATGSDSDNFEVGSCCLYSGTLNAASARNYCRSCVVGKRTTRRVRSTFSSSQLGQSMPIASSGSGQRCWSITTSLSDLNSERTALR